MTKILLILVLFTVSFIHASKAQTADSLQTNKYGISIGYWGTPTITTGFQLGLQKYNLQTEKYKILTSADLIIEKRPDSYTSFGLLLSSGVRRTLKFGLYFEYDIKAGYIGTYYPFDLYNVNSNGDVVNIGRKVFNTFVFGNSFGLGYDFFYKTKLNLQLFIKPIIYYRYPNNDNPFFLNNFGLEAGITFHPSFLNTIGKNGR